MLVMASILAVFHDYQLCDPDILEKFTFIQIHFLSVYPMSFADWPDVPFLWHRLL